MCGTHGWLAHLPHSAACRQPNCERQTRAPRLDVVSPDRAVEETSSRLRGVCDQLTAAAVEYGYPSIRSLPLSRLASANTASGRRTIAAIQGQHHRACVLHRALVGTRCRAHLAHLLLAGEYIRSGAVGPRPAGWRPDLPCTRAPHDPARDCRGLGSSPQRVPVATVNIGHGGCGRAGDSRPNLHRDASLRSGPKSSRDNRYRVRLVRLRLHRWPPRSGVGRRRVAVSMSPLRPHLQRRVCVLTPRSESVPFRPTCAHGRGASGRLDAGLYCGWARLVVGRRQSSDLGHRTSARL